MLLEWGICTFLTRDDFPGAGHLNRKTDLSSNPPPMPGLPPPLQLNIDRCINETKLKISELLVQYLPSYFFGSLFKKVPQKLLLWMPWDWTTKQVLIQNCSLTPITPKRHKHSHPFWMGVTTSSLLNEQTEQMGYILLQSMVYHGNENYRQGKKLFLITLVHWTSDIQILVVRKLNSLVRKKCLSE